MKEGAVQDQWKYGADLYFKTLGKFFTSKVWLGILFSEESQTTNNIAEIKTTKKHK